jgi:hypothetical protein
MHAGNDEVTAKTTTGASRREMLQGIGAASLVASGLAFGAARSAAAQDATPAAGAPAALTIEQISLA